MLLNNNDRLEVYHKNLAAWLLRGRSLRTVLIRRLSHASMCGPRDGQQCPFCKNAVVIVSFWSCPIVPQVYCRLLVVAGLLLTGLSADVMAQGPSKELAIKLMSLPPRPKRPDLPASELPLEFLQGERVAFLGNSLAERMNLFGHFETLLHTRFPKKELVVRNFARPAEEVGIQQRSADYAALDDPQ